MAFNLASCHQNQLYFIFKINLVVFNFYRVDLFLVGSLPFSAGNFVTFLSVSMTWQKIQAEILAHESTLEELKKSARSFPPASPECRSPRGGTQLDTLQVKI